MTFRMTGASKKLRARYRKALEEMAAMSLTPLQGDEHHARETVRWVEGLRDIMRRAKASSPRPSDDSPSDPPTGS